MWRFALLVKLPAFLADGVLVWLLMSPRRLGRPVSGWLMALNPLSIAITGMLGQFDAIPAVLLLASIGLRDRDHMKSGFLYGLAVAVKTWPAFFAPTVLSLTARRSWPSMIAGIALVPAACFAIYGWFHPDHLLDGIHRAFGYQNLPSNLGTSFLISNNDAGARLIPILNLLAGLSVLVLALVSSRGRWDACDAIAAGALVLCALSPSTSPQYLLWPLPFLLAASRDRLVAVYSCGLLLPMAAYMTNFPPWPIIIFAGELTIMGALGTLLVTAHPEPHKARTQGAA